MLQKLDEAITRLFNCEGVSGAFNYKKSKERCRSFQEYLESLLDDYKRTFEETGWDFGQIDLNNNFTNAYRETVISVIDNLNKGIKSSIRSYLNGHPSEAYTHFSRMMESEIGTQSPTEKTDDIQIMVCEQPSGQFRLLANSDDSNEVFLKTESIGALFERVSIRPESGLFRVRLSENKHEIKEREDIFHVPFQHRHTVKTARYSIPGFPCLYLGGSLYACWEEMQRPCLDSVFLSLFKIKKDVKIFAVSFLSPSDVKSHLLRCANNNDAPNTSVLSQIAYFLSRWPLDLACSIPRKNENAPFHPEYIIPQLLLQWVIKTQKHDALCFRSVQICDNGSMSNWPRYLNYVFHPKETSGEEYSSHLKSIFEFTEPISWELIPKGGTSWIMDEVAESVSHVKGGMAITLCKNPHERYIDTDFGQAERYVSDEKRFRLEKLS